MSINDINHNFCDLFKLREGYFSYEIEVLIINLEI